MLIFCTTRPYAGFSAFWPLSTLAFREIHPWTRFLEPTFYMFLGQNDSLHLFPTINKKLRFPPFNSSQPGFTSQLFPKYFNKTIRWIYLHKKALPLILINLDLSLNCSRNTCNKTLRWIIFIEKPTFKLNCSFKVRGNVAFVGAAL